MTSPKSRNASTATISRFASYMPLASNMELTKNWCSSSLRMIGCNYTWTIHNFSYQVDNNEMLKSSSFSAGTDNDITWRLHLYPNGDGEENKGHVSLFLCLVESNSLEVAALFEFAIIDAGGKRTNTVSIRRKFKRENGRWGSPCGHKRFVSVASLTNVKKRLLSNNALTILCDVKVFKETVKAARQSSPIPLRVGPTCSLSDDLSLMFQNKEFSDVLFTVSDEKFYAHKAILTARSPVFSAMLQREAGEPRLQMVNLSKVKKEVFAEMLRYVYTGKAPSLASFPRDLLTVAHDYKLARLKSMCELELCKNLTAENAADILTLAELHDAKQLKERTKDFIILHMEEVKSTEGFKEMAKSQPSLMIDVVSALARKINARLD